MSSPAYKAGYTAALIKVGVVDRREGVEQSHLEAKNEDWPRLQRYADPHTRASGDGDDVDQVWATQEAARPMVRGRINMTTESTG